MEQPGIYIAVGVLLLILSALLKSTTDTRSEVRKINGRLGRLEEWRMESTKLRDQQQKESERRLEKLEL